MTTLGGGILDLLGVSFVVDFAVDVALALGLVAPDSVAVAPGAAPLVAAPLLAAPPEPATVTTCTGGLLALVLLPERPISTPIPIASSSIPMPAISVLFTDMRGRSGMRPADVASPLR